MGALATRISDLDRRWLVGVASRHAPPWLDMALRGLTHLGGATCTLLLGVVLLAVASTRPVGLALLLANASSHLAVQVVKRTAGRPRPHFPDEGIEALVAHPDEFSLPSGHSAAAMSVAMTLLLWTGAEVAGWVAGVALGLAVVIGVSRVYLRVHYVTDVMLGQALGALGAVLATRLVG